MFKLTCTSYPDKAQIPVKHAHAGVPGGKNISPGFTWEDPPVNSKSFALSIVDPHPVAKNWVHWFVVDIPFRERKISEGASRTSDLPAGCKSSKAHTTKWGTAALNHPVAQAFTRTLPRSTR